MEVAVATTGGALEGARVGGVSGGGRHELAAPVKCMATYAGGVVLETFLVGNYHHGRWRRCGGGGGVVVALVCAVGER